MSLVGIREVGLKRLQVLALIVEGGGRLGSGAFFDRGSLAKEEALFGNPYSMLGHFFGVPKKKPWYVGVYFAAHCFGNSQSRGLLYSRIRIYPQTCMCISYVYRHICAFVYVCM